MSKTRTNRPNNTTSKLSPRMVHASKEYSWNPVTRIFMPLPGITYNVGRNAEKRRRRALPWSVR